MLNFDKVAFRKGDRLQVTSWLAGLSILLSVCSMQIALAQPGSRAKPVQVAKVEARRLAPANWYSGTVISREKAQLAAAVGGRLLWVAEVGEQIEKGEIVARVDDILLREELAERKADAQRIVARQSYLKKELSRLQRLAKKNNAAQSQLEKTKSDLAAVDSELVAARARTRKANEQVKRCLLRATFPGVVTARLLHAGEWAESGNAVVAMTDPLNLEAQSWVPVSVLRFLKVGQSLDLKIGGDHSSGNVRALVPVGDRRSHLYELRVSLPEGMWTVSENLKISVPTAASREVLAVLRDALVLRRESISLFSIDEENIATQIKVQTGIASGAYIEVTGDVKTGDQIVIRGGERLRNGQTVSILPASQPQ